MKEACKNQVLRFQGITPQEVRHGGRAVQSGERADGRVEEPGDEFPAELIREGIMD
jgi:hypothetical protein